ncbi:MAG: Xaa-Pro peptidase family protein [Pseudomonadota bacterium]
MHPDQLILHHDRWSELAPNAHLDAIDQDRLHEWHLHRLREQLHKHQCAALMLVSPISLRYAFDYRTYSLFQSHIPTTYGVIGQTGKPVLFNAYGPLPDKAESHRGHPNSFFDGGNRISEYATQIASDLVAYLQKTGTDCRRIALEYVNPSLTLALDRLGFEVIDGVKLAEMARIIKSPDEIACMHWACAVAEHAIETMRAAIRPGVSELQLWGILNYTNLANQGDWHEGRMLASGPRINPWLQEATVRKLESGDLVGFDTDMVGPFGYCADISRTFHCGPAQPTKRQKQLHQLAIAEVEYNIALLRPGLSFEALREQAFKQDECYHQNAYHCVLHGVGMCDEYPQIVQPFFGPQPYDGTLEAGMVVCVESYVGAVGEHDGIKHEEQVLITDEGTKRISTCPLDPRLLD